MGIYILIGITLWASGVVFGLIIADQIDWPPEDWP